jgi:hypothetical protein
VYIHGRVRTAIFTTSSSDLAKVNLISVLFRVLSGRTDIDYPARGGARAAPD